MEKDEVYLYLKQVSLGGTFKHYELYYKMELADGKNAISWHPSEGAISEENSGVNSVFVWKDLQDLNPGSEKNHLVELKVDEAPEKISQDGVIKIIGLAPRDFSMWEKIRVTVRLVDKNGDPIGGNGSTVHYGDAD